MASLSLTASTGSGSGKDEVKEIMQDKLEIVNLDIPNLLKYMQTVVEIGSTKFKLTKGSITIQYTSPDDAKSADFWKLIEQGTRFFDALAYLSLSNKDGVKFIDSTTIPKKEIPTLSRVCDAVYYWYFILMTRGNWPKPGEVLQGGQLPAFINKVMLIDGESDVMEKIVATFDLRTIPTNWIKYIQIPRLGVETRQRLALSFPGYRLFHPFNVVPTTKVLSEQEKVAISAIKRFLKRGYFWDIHSATRNPALIQQHGSINNVLGNLLLRVYTTAEIQNMRSEKMIAVIPTEKYGAHGWQKWILEEFDGFVDKITL